MRGSWMELPTYHCKKYIKCLFYHTAVNYIVIRQLDEINACWNLHQKDVWFFKLKSARSSVSDLGRLNHNTTGLRRIKFHLHLKY